MVESTVHKILTRVVGKYLEGFNRENLNISIWGGDINLDNVEIKSEVFKEELGLPFDIKFGKIKRLHVKVPWTRIQSSPIELVLESLMLVVTPIKSNLWKPKEGQNFQQKMLMLQDLTEMLVTKLKFSLSGQKEDIKDEGVFDKLITKIIDNIQVTIKNIHIRYEVDLSDAPSYVVGFTLQELSLHATNSKWEKTFYDRTKEDNKNKPLYNKLEIKGLAIYLHHQSTENSVNRIKEIKEKDFNHKINGQSEYLEFYLLKNLSKQMIEQEMLLLFPLNAQKIIGMPYFIEPIMLNLNLIRLIKFEIDQPKIFINFNLEELNVSLSRKQYEIILLIAEYFKHYSKLLEKQNASKKYNFLRPLYPLGFIPASTDFIPISFKSRKLDLKNLVSQLKSSQSSSQSEFQRNQEYDQQSHSMNNASRIIEESKISSICINDDLFISKLDRRSQLHERWRFAIECIIRENRFKRGFWNEFKVTSWRKKEYAKHLINLAQKCLTSSFTFELKHLRSDELILFQHIVEANQMSDIQNWLGIILKRRLESEKAVDDAKKERERKQGGFFGRLFGKSSELAHQEEVKSSNSYPKFLQNDDLNRLTEADLEQIEITLRQLMTEDDSNSERSQIEGLGLTELQKQKQIKLRAQLSFKRGRINLLIEQHKVELYQDDLGLTFDLRRDTSFVARIDNRNVGINVIDQQTSTSRELVVKHFSNAVEEQKIQGAFKDETKQWRLQIEKKGSLEDGFITDIYFESNPIKLKYDAESINKVAKFFQTANNEELRDQALNKISALKESTQSSLRDLIYKQKNNIRVKIASPILEMPFLAHNSLVLGEQGVDRERMWLVSLGNIDFGNCKPVNAAAFQGYQIDGSNKPAIDEYERFRVEINSIGLIYVKNMQQFRALENLTIILDIGIKNKIKAALISGQDDNSANLYSPEVIVEAKLPSIILNATPDVYNALVNLNQVLTSQGQDEHLRQLKLEKDHIVKNSYYINEEVQTRGLRGQLSSNWQASLMLLSGSYIYFFKTRRDLMPMHYIYIGNCQISSQHDVRDAAIQGNGFQSDLENTIILKNQTTGEKLYMKFKDEVDSDTLVRNIVRSQQKLQGEVNILRQQDIVSELIHKDQREVGFKLTLIVQNVEARIWQDTQKAVKNQREGTFDDMWLVLDIEEFTFSLVKYQYEIKLGFTLSSLSISEALKIKKAILMNEPGQNLCKIDIDVFDLYSPNLKDAEIIVSVELCKLYLMFEPQMINELFKFFRNTISYQVQDVESLNVRLMDESEEFISQIIQQKSIDSPAQVKKLSVQTDTCKTVELILVKVIVKASGLTLIAIHNQYYTPVFELTVGDSVFHYLMHYDHDIIQGDFSNARLYDLTNYPKTFDPSIQAQVSLSDFYDDQNNVISRQEVIGIREELELNKKCQSAIHFKSVLYTEKCPLHKPGITSSLSVDIASVKIVYFFEMSFRIIDYFFDKLLWAITESDPYVKFDSLGNQEYEKIDLSRMTPQEVMGINMKQEKNSIEMTINIHKPHILIKDRPYLNSNLEVDLGQLSISFAEKELMGRFKRVPQKTLIQSKFVIQCRDVVIRFSKDRFEVTQPFNLKVVFGYLTRTDLLHMIDSQELDKSYEIDINFEPSLQLNLREDIYTYFLRCLDLNLAYTDNLDSKFNFTIEQEYFRSSSYLLKSRTNIFTQYLALSLYTINGEKLTEIGINSAEVQIDYFLNKRCNYLINVGEMSSFFIHESYQKLILFGNKSQVQAVENFEDIQACICENQFPSPSKIEVKIQMHPDGTKNFQIDISEIKLFVYPYFYLMIDHFFKENLPAYDQHSFDKPNDYNEDYEELPEMSINFKLSNSLICLANTDQLGLDGPANGIACQANLEYQFRREKIKKVKIQLWDKLVQAQQQNQGQGNQVNVDLPFSWMSLIMKDFSPYICDLSKLEIQNFDSIQKRQLINPFNLMFHFGRFMRYRSKEGKIFIFERTETKKDKSQIKFSFKDTLLLRKLFDQLNESYQRFLLFQKTFLSQKRGIRVRNDDMIRNSMNNSASFISKTQKILRSINGGVTGKNYDVKSSFSQAFNQIEQEKYYIAPKNNAQMTIEQKKEEFLKQIIDYEAESVLSSTKIISQGMQIVIINDSNNVFYPVITLSLQNFDYKSVGEFGSFTGESTLKVMISYYNSIISEWEPLVEKTQIELISNFCKGQVFHLVSFKTNLNINLTTQFLQILMKSKSQLLELLNADSQEKSPATGDIQMLQINQQSSQRQNRTQAILEQRASLMMRPGIFQEEQKGSNDVHGIEYKVTPYTIINYSARTITVKSVYYVKGDNKLKEYIIPPGQKADYEVDYEEEVKHLTKHVNDQVVKKQDFLNVSFDRNGLGIKDINLRHSNFYTHQINDRVPDDFVTYGVKFENMRKILIIRTPYVFNNLTDLTFKLRFVNAETMQIIKTLNFEPGQCYPIDVTEMDLKFQLCNVHNQDDWSSLIRVRTVALKIPKKATTFLYHGKQFTIIMKEKSDHQSSFNINFKTPVIIKNALPCNIRIRTDIIIGKIGQTSGANAPNIGQVDKNQEEFKYEQKELCIERGQSMKLHNFNLQKKVDFLFNLDSDISHENQDFNRQSNNPARQSESKFTPPDLQIFQWGSFSALNTEFRDEKSFLIKDYENPLCAPLQIYAKMSKSNEAGVQITFFVKNLVINNTDQRLLIYYQLKNQLYPVGGQYTSYDNSIILLSQASEVVACLEDFDQRKAFSKSFKIDVAGFTDTIQIQRKDQKQFHEFTVKTEMSRACENEEIYTKVTTISPCYVLHNKTNKTIMIKQEGCDDQCQILLSGARQPFFWKDANKPRLVRIMCIEKQGAEFDDDSHEWTFNFSLNEVGRMTILNRHKRSLNRSKHLLVEKQLQEENQILFITFQEETPQFATYRIQNRSKNIHIEYHQKDFPNHTAILLPENSSIFSWTNPHFTDYKITCKFFGLDGGQEMDQKLSRIDIEPDNLELNVRFELPQHLSLGKKNSALYIYTITNGFSKILVFSDISQEQAQRKKDQAQDEELKEGDEIQTKTFKLEILSIGLSLITQTYQEKRKEFAFIYFEDLKFLVLETEKKRESQLKIGYAQIDNNISQKQLFQVIAYPKELFMKRDQALENKKKDSTEEIGQIKEFFNMHIIRRLDDPEVLFIEQIQFLLQTLVLQVDDEFIGYIFRFTETLNTHIIGVHDVFKSQLSSKPDSTNPSLNKYPDSPQDLKFNPNIQSVLESEEQEEQKLDQQSSQCLLSQMMKMNDEIVKEQQRIGGMLKLPQNQKSEEKLTSASPRFTQGTSNRDTIGGSSTNSYSQQNSQSWLNYELNNKAKMLYIKVYKSSPIDIELSYVTKIKTKDTEIDEQANKKFSLADKLRNYGLTLINLERVSVRINSLVLSNIFGTQDEIMFQLNNHYLSLLKKNIFMIFGQTFFGGPANFISHLGTGVQDFFYYPISGMVKGPLEGGLGIVKGTTSLIQNTVQGTFGSASKALSQVSKGLLLITSDGDYINKREQKSIQERPSNLIEGVGYGLKSTFKGIASGVVGVFEKPVEGAQKDGVKGFMKGAYKGLSGLVVKPVSGALDFFSKTTEGIKNNVSMQKEKKVKRIRMIRPFYGSLQLIKGYNEFHSEVIHHLLKVEKGRYKNLNFIDAILHNEIGERKKKVVIMTEELFIIMDPAHRDIERIFRSQRIMTATINQSNIVIHVADDKDDLKIGFSMNIPNEKSLLRTQKQLQSYIYHIRTEIVAKETIQTLKSSQTKK